MSLPIPTPTSPKTKHLEFFGKIMQEIMKKKKKASLWKNKCHLKLVGKVFGTNGTLDGF